MNSIAVDQKTISALQKLVTGDTISSQGPLAPYRSGPELIVFFNQFNRDEEYGEGFPSRWMYAEAILSELNGTPVFKKVIESIVDPRVFVSTEYSIDIAADYLNQFLEFDDLTLQKQGSRYSLSSTNQHIISFENTFLVNEEANFDFIREQIIKCESKINDGDFDGSITNARSLLESVLIEIESQFGEALKYNGDLNQLYKRVQKLLNLEPSRKDISDSLKKILTGIISIIGGIAPLRNKMSDSHARSYKPSGHHAKLAVNSVNTISMFLLESFEFQVKNGHVKLAHNKINKDT